MLYCGSVDSSMMQSLCCIITCRHWLDCVRCGQYEANTWCSIKKVYNWLPYRLEIYKLLNKTSSRIVLPPKVIFKNSTSSVYSSLYGMREKASLHIHWICSTRMIVLLALKPGQDKEQCCIKVAVVVVYKNGRFPMELEKYIKYFKTIQTKCWIGRWI